MMVPLRALIALILVWGFYSTGCRTARQAGSLRRQLTGVLFAFSSVILTGQVLSCTGQLQVDPWLGLLAVLWGGLELVLRKYGATAKSLETETSCPPAARVTERLLLGLTLFLAVIGISIPIHSTDMVTYHLPRAMLWLEHGSTFLPEQPIARLQYIGVNVSLLYAFVLACWSAAWIPSLHAAAFWVMGASVLLLARKQKLTEWWTRSLLVLLWGIPSVLNHTLGAGVDIFLAAFVLAAIGYIATGRGTLMCLAAAGAFLGLALGTKGSVIPIAGMVVFWCTVREWKGGTHAPWLCFAGMIMLCGGFSYLQNWISAGHPFGGEVFRWVVSNPGLNNLAGNAERFFFRSQLEAYDVLYRLLPVWSWLGVSIAAAALAWRARNYFLLQLILISASSLLAELFLIRGSEVSILMRLCMPAMAVGWIAGAAAVLEHGGKILRLGFVSLAMLLAGLYSAHYFGPLPGGALFSYSRAQGSWTPGLLFASKVDVAGRHYPGRLELLKETGLFGAEPLRIGYMGRRNAWILWGETRQHQVLYIQSESLMNIDVVEEWFEDASLDVLLLEGRQVNVELRERPPGVGGKEYMMENLPAYAWIDFTEVLQRLERAGYEVRESSHGPVMITKP